VFAEDEAALLCSAAAGAELEEMVGRRVDGEPLEQVLGWVDFCGTRVALDPGVFVPRRRTELLVREAARRTRAGNVVVDLCCGSGAVAVALAARVPGVRLFAVDVDPVAVACARRNVPGIVLCGDLYDPLPQGLRRSVDVLVVNAPYVPTDEIAMMPAEARLHEPRAALDGGADGVEVHRRVAAAAAEWLHPGGWLLVETSERQADLTARAFSANSLRAHVVHCDDLGATVVAGQAVAQGLKGAASP
jgi:release factor glutamine methyltransferase